MNTNSSESNNNNNNNSKIFFRRTMAKLYHYFTYRYRYKNVDLVKIYMIEKYDDS